jgi:hypothetical protein
MLDEFRVGRMDMKVMDGTRRYTYVLKDLLTAGSHQPTVARVALPAQ